MTLQVALQLFFNNIVSGGIPQCQNRHIPVYRLPDFLLH